MVLVAVLTAGLIGGGVAGISQFAEADRPDLATQPTDDSSNATMPSVDDAESPGDDRDDEPDIVDGAVARMTECLGLPAFDVPFDIGDWEQGEGPSADSSPFDLDELFEDGGDLGEFFDEFEFDADGEFGGFDTDGSVTVTGPDGTSVIDLGENGSVTVSRDGDDLTITTDGDATVSDLADLFDDVGTVFESMPFDDELFDELFDDLFDDEAVDEFLETLPGPDDVTELESIDPETVQSCLDEILGG